MKKIIITLLIASSVLVACAQEYKIYSPMRIYGYLAINHVTVLPANPTYFTMVTYQDTLRIYGASGWKPLWPQKVTGAGVGSVTSINVSGGTTGLTTVGGPVTSTGTITLTGTLNPAHGGTGIYSYTEGDLLYGSGATTLSKLSAVAIGNVLISQGVGTVPIWSKISLTSHVNGVLPVANGGTGLSEWPTESIGDVKVSGLTSANTIAYWSGTDSTLVSNDVMKPYNDSLVITQEVRMRDSLKLLLFEGHGLYPWLTLINSNVDTLETENLSWIGLVMPQSKPSKYLNDQKEVDGHKELLIYYVDSETKELKSQHGWGRLDMMETQSAYQIFHERALRYIVDQEKQIDSLQKQVDQNKRSVLKRKVKDMEQRLEAIENIVHGR